LGMTGGVSTQGKMNVKPIEAFIEWSNKAGGL